MALFGSYLAVVTRSAFLVGVVLCHAFSISLFWSLLIAYIPSYIDGSEYDGTRAWPELQRVSFWRVICEILLGPLRIVCDVPLDHGRQSILACAPHGVLSGNHALLFTDAAGFLTKHFSHDRRDLGATIIFRIPIFREIFIWAGCVDASKQTAQKMLKQGKSLQVYPGGEAEQLMTEYQKHRTYIKFRKGFARLAVEFGCDVIPVYAFGNKWVMISCSMYRTLEGHDRTVTKQTEPTEVA